MESIIHSRTLAEKRRHSIAKRPEVYQYKKIESPVGALTLIADASALLSLSWGRDLPDHLFLEIGKNNLILSTAEKQLREYFLGKRLTFDLPLKPIGTEFQKCVWQQLLKIPYGQTISYREQARRIGRPKAMRAVGAANGKNPIGIIIPCHRVIGANGDLTGFAGGLDIKRQLLSLERA